MTPQDANPAGYGRADGQPPFVPTMTPGPDDRRRSYGRRVGDRFPALAEVSAAEVSDSAGAGTSVTGELYDVPWDVLRDSLLLPGIRWHSLCECFPRRNARRVEAIERTRS